MSIDPEKWPAKKIVWRSLGDLTPYARNPRTHTADQVNLIAAAIREWGWTSPIIIDEHGTILAGHARLEAARKLDLDAVPCLEATGWSEAKKRALVIADNQLSINGAGWDADLLRVELADLQELDFDLGLIGFGDDELTSWLAEPTTGLTDPDDVPEVTEEAVAVAGDVWLLGRHRLVCGDSTEAETVERALNGVQPHLMVTDPPYGVNYDPTARRSIQSVNSKPAQGRVANDDRVDWREAWALFPGEVAYVWCAPGPLQYTVYEALIASGFDVRQQIIWAKPRFVIGRGHYHYQHEPLFYAVRKGGKGYWSGDRSQSTLWTIDHRKSETGHGTQKPVECMKRPIENNSSPGQAIYEPFSGSGTTIIAAEMTGRACHAIELDPGYVDVAIKRWMAFTGKHATLEATGQTFAKVNRARWPETTEAPT